MATTVKDVSIRISTDGKEAVKSDYAEIGASAEQASDKAATAAEAAAARQEAAYKRQADAAKAAYLASSTQSGIAAAYGIGAAPSKSASDSASVFAEQAKAMEDLQRRTDALKASIDPLWAAQNRLGAATKEASDLLAAGTINEAQHAAALKLAQVAYDDAAKAAKGMGAATGFSTMQMQEFGAVAHRSFDALAAGMPISRVATMEGARLSGAFASGEGGVGGALKMVGSVAFSTWGLMALGGGVLAGLIIASEAFEAGQQKIIRTLQGVGAASGLSMMGFQAFAEAQSKAAGISVSQARDIEAAMISTGRVTGDNIGPAIGVVRNYAAALGIDLKQATQKLSGAFADPAKGAEMLNGELHFLTAAQVDQIKTTEEQGDRVGALKLLIDGLSKSVSGASAHMGEWAAMGHNIHVAWDEATDAVGRFIAKLAGVGDGSPADTIKRLQAQRAALVAQGPGKFSSPYSTYDAALAATDKALADAQAEAGKDKARTDQAKLSEASTNLKSAATALNPIAEQIKTIQNAQTQLRGALGNAALLSASGLTADQAKASIAQGDIEIANLKKRAQAHDAHAESLKRELASMQANASGSIAMAYAYLSSDAAGEKAEATRKAVTDATKKGGDIAEFVAAQLAEAAAAEVATGAKQVAALRDDLKARTAVYDAVASGQITIEQANAQLAKEAALRPLVAAQTNGDAKAKEAAIETARQLADVMDRNNAELAREAVLKANANDNDRLDQLKLEIALVGDLSGAREQALARLKASQSSAQATPGEQASREDLAAAVAAEESALKRSQYYASTILSQQNSYDLVQAELGLIGKTQAEHDAILDRLRLEQQLKAQGVDLTSAEAQKILAMGASIDTANAKLRAMQEDWAEIKSAGDTFVDDVLSPNNWTNWGDFGKKIITDLIAEFAKLSLANPLKNALFGESLPTSGSLFSTLFGGLGGGGAATSTLGSVDLFKTPLHFASGTNYAPGGLAQVDEKGAELMDLPRGATVVNASKSIDLVSAAASETLANMQRAANTNTAGPTVVINMPINQDNRGVDAGQVVAINSRLDNLQKTLPATIVQTFNDQAGRGRIRLGRAK